MQPKVSNVLAFTALALLVGFVPCESYAQHPIEINEIRIDQPQTDVDEFFELTGPPNFSLTPYAYLVIGDGGGGGSGVIEEVIPLAGQFINPVGFFVAAEPTFTLGVPDLVTNLIFENSDNVTHMLVENFTGFLGQDLDLNDDCILDLFPWAVVVDVIGVIEEPNPPVTTECHYGPPTVGPDGAFAPGHVHRCPDSIGAFVIAAFDTGIDDTPGAANLCGSLYEPGTAERPPAAPTGSASVNGLRYTSITPAGPPTKQLAIYHENVARDGNHDRWIDILSIDWGKHSPRMYGFNGDVVHRCASSSGGDKPVVTFFVCNSSDGGGADSEWKYVNVRRFYPGEGTELWDIVGSVVHQGASVYGFSGEYTLSGFDLGIPGRGLDFVWARKYRSRVGPNTAQGNGWDFSYKIFIEQAGTDVILHDGNTRADLYVDQGNGTWSAPLEFFREFTIEPDDSYTLTFPDKGTWNFSPLDGSPEQGKISSIKDRNDNTISFDYDNQGRLVTIHDPLDTEAHNRDIIIAYNADGFIESVTDFIGRMVTYAYYQNGDDGGSAGDLKSATTPAVTGTSTGNDFPDGKTTVYTYSKDFGNENLNHNLLTITDPKGQTYLLNEYYPTTDPADINFDRIQQQIRGDAGDIIDFVYVPQVPSEENNNAIVKTIVNDRVGNVQEHFYDARNRGVLMREYTGRAPDPDAPTTEIDNRPIGQLRPDDPPFFETRCEWNDDSLPTKIEHPNGNEATFAYDEANPNRRSQGNLTEFLHLPGPLGGDQPQIVQLFEYDEVINFDHNLVTRHTDGQGNDTFHEYDAAGNRLHTQHRKPSIVEDFAYNEFGQIAAYALPDNGSGHRRIDGYTYHDSGPQRGYLHAEIVDVDGFNLITSFEYDDVGNVIRRIDPRGKDSLYEVNQLNQVVRSTSREVTGGSGVRYERDAFYDANDNVVRVDIQNIDDQGVEQTNTHLTTVFEHDILNYRVRTCQESGEYLGAIPGPPELPTCDGLPGSDFITTEYEFDENRNRTRVRFGEATNGNQPTNEGQSIYDERDLLFRSVRAPGDADQSTNQFDYDGNRSLKRTHQGLEEDPRITEYAYDGYDRLTGSLDAMGNTAECHYDPNSNRIHAIRAGELVDEFGQGVPVRLAESFYTYDEMDRLIRTDVEFFDAASQNPIGDGQATTQVFFSDNSQILSTFNDNDHGTNLDYDTANRLLMVTDAKGNTVTYDYNPNSSVTAVTELERSDLGNPDEIYVTSYVYDGLDRLTSTTDNVGNMNHRGYDSRDNRTVRTDALDHETRYVYDGIDRLTANVRDMNDNGASVTDFSDLLTILSYDDSSRRIGFTDDNGNNTQYEYDALNRRTEECIPDLTKHIYTYDVHDNAITAIDANDSLATRTYDLLNRLTRTDVVPGPGVSNDTTFENYQYDGLSRLVSLEDDDSLIVRIYDSLSRVTSETLNGRTTNSLYDGVGNLTELTYPGGRTITFEYDELENVQSFQDLLDILSAFSYVGPRRLERIEYGNGTRTDYTYDGIVPNPPDFGVRQIVGTTHSVIQSGEILDARAYSWDKMYNKTQRSDVRIGGPELTHDYAYDAVYRLVHSTATDAGQQVVHDMDYELDGVGNREVVTTDDVPGVYFMDPQSPPADLPVNQYSDTAFDHRSYDDNGNLIRQVTSGDSDGDGDVDAFDFEDFLECISLPGGEVSEECRIFDCDHDGDVDFADFGWLQEVYTGSDGELPAAEMSYDYRNRMVEYRDTQSGARHTYAYDAFGRRIVRIVDADGDPGQTRYFYDGVQVIEEQHADGTTRATYVYAPTGFNGTSGATPCTLMTREGDDFYYYKDDLSNVMAVGDAKGAVVERYAYHDYGETSLFDGEGLPIEQSAIGNKYAYRSLRFDSESGWYLNEYDPYKSFKYYDALAGRFTTRANSKTRPIIADNTAYTAFDSNPWSAVGVNKYTGEIYQHDGVDTDGDGFAFQRGFVAGTSSGWPQGDLNLDDIHDTGTASSFGGNGGQARISSTGKPVTVPSYTSYTGHTSGFIFPFPWSLGNGGNGGQPPISSTRKPVTVPSYSSYSQYKNAGTIKVGSFAFGNEEIAIGGSYAHSVGATPFSGISDYPTSYPDYGLKKVIIELPDFGISDYPRPAISGFEGQSRITFSASGALLRIMAGGEEVHGMANEETENDFPGIPFLGVGTPLRYDLDLTGGDPETGAALAIRRLMYTIDRPPLRYDLRQLGGVRRDH